MSGPGTSGPGQYSRSGGGGEFSNNQRYSNLIYDSDVFLTKLREFKPQSLGCLEARRKSSSTLIFPNPQQACMGPPKCSRYPHDIKPTLGYWIECHGSGRNTAGSKATVGYTSFTSHHGDSQSIRRASDEVSMSATDEFHSQSQQFEQNIRPSQAKLDEPRLSIECASRSSGSAVSPHLPTTPTAEKVITRHDIEFNPDQDDDLIRSDQSRIRQFSRQDSRSTPTVEFDSKQVGPSDQSSKRSGDKRKRLSKRTMTRDDIDLHKPRRGTPNITITESSFSQSITSYQPTSTVTRRFRAPRQGSQTSEYKHQDSIDSTVSGEPIPIKFQIQSCMSIEAQSSIDLDTPKSTTNTYLRRQDSSDNDDQPCPSTSTAQDTVAFDFKPYRSHRPSVICEDVDLENENAPLPQQQEDRETYCGLSMTAFNKNSYLQSNQEIQDTEIFRDGSLELISFEEENYEKHYYGREHWNYFTNDELLGPVMLSLKQEVNNQRDHFHVLLRTVSYTLHGTIPASTICADRYDREAIVRELSEIAKLKPPLMLGQLPSTPDDLLKLDHIFIKTELKVGVIYIKEGQEESEEAILGNRGESPQFLRFLDLLGDRIKLKGFDRYKGGLDTVHNLTGTESVYTLWRNIEIMFHVSTMLPHEENDPQKLQKKRHIGNDIVCVAFIESDDTQFWPGCIKSYFLHTFITVRTSPKPLKEGEKRKYSVSCVCRNEVQYAFKPYLIEEDEFYESDYFREWLLVKIVNGERASYSAPKFARMQDRTRSQLLEDIITNLANHLVTGQIPKPYRRGSWRPLGHTRASSPLEDSMKDYFEDYDQLAKDFCNAFCGPSRSMLCDVVFRVKDKDGSYKLVHGVRAIMAIRSKIFLEMLYGFVPPGAGSSSLQNHTNLRAIEMKALSGESQSPSTKEAEHTKSLLSKRGSFGADSGKKMNERERRLSMLPNLSRTVAQKPNYLTVPNTSGEVGAGSGTGGMIKNAFNRIVSGNWSGWSGNIKSYRGEPMHIKVDQNKTKIDINSLAICKEISKIDADKLSQREFEVKEFDYETFQQTIEYIHNGQCKLSYETIPGLICAAEHYDLPDLLHACFHHANTHMKLCAAPKMMNALYQNSCFYVTAMQLLESIYEFIDPLGNEFFSKPDYFELYESVFTTLLSRRTLQVSESKKFQAMHEWTKNQMMIKLQKKQQQLQKQRSSDQDAKLVDIETIEPHEAPPLEASETEYMNLMVRLNKEVNIKLDKISNEDLVKIVLPTKVFANEKVFDVMSDEARIDY